ncbi:hypothetical protein TREAZ_1829 [Leadbettera azotonutricia ZAS-9]|uniref:Uncharacterized protein n=1 Tax=Leadbettera azotonutricia (strain ATCC BAA-888 / DSM 13862 / ZAS-9) TaxID=545695 RepID=F5YBX7_LEAAZ|nr:hypothetical protein TREAZ_1829 [Leadbettera azotonutricia ZAS-9]
MFFLDIRAAGDFKYIEDEQSNKVYKRWGLSFSLGYEYGFIDKR